MLVDSGVLSESLAGPIKERYQKWRVWKKAENMDVDD